LPLKALYDKTRKDLQPMRIKIPDRKSIHQNRLALVADDFLINQEWIESWFLKG
jgi:hypothetical protein